MSTGAGTSVTSDEACVSPAHSQNKVGEDTDELLRLFEIGGDWRGFLGALPMSFDTHNIPTTITNAAARFEYALMGVGRRCS